MQDVNDVGGFLTEGGLEVLAVHPFHFDDVAALLSRISQRAAKSGNFQAADDVELVGKFARCRPASETRS